MLARASSDAGTRLRRSKSASTVHWRPPPCPELFDPQVAQQQALAAATAAFARTQHEPPVHSKKWSSELFRTKSTSSRKSLKSQGSHFPPREAGVRSSKPSHVRQAPQMYREPRVPNPPMDKFPPFYPTPDNDRPRSAQASTTANENIRPGSQHKSHRQSAASSITSQQIRKARSMYYASSVQTGSPMARPPVKYLTTPPPNSVTPTSSSQNPSSLLCCPTSTRLLRPPLRLNATSDCGIHTDFRLAPKNFPAPPFSSALL